MVSSIETASSNKCDRKGKNTGKVQSITHGHISLRENDRGLQKER